LNHSDDSSSDLLLEHREKREKARTPRLAGKQQVLRSAQDDNSCLVQMTLFITQDYTKLSHFRMLFSL
jgi:hypothetical protein